MFSWPGRKIPYSEKIYVYRILCYKTIIPQNSDKISFLGVLLSNICPQSATAIFEDEHTLLWTETQTWSVNSHEMTNNISTHYLMSVMFCVLTLSVVDLGFKSRSGQIKHYKIGISCFSVSKKTSWLEIRIMFRSGVTYLPTDCCFNKLPLCKSN